MSIIIYYINKITMMNDLCLSDSKTISNVELYNSKKNNVLY